MYIQLAVFPLDGVCINKCLDVFISQMQIKVYCSFPSINFLMNLFEISRFKK